MYEIYAPKEYVVEPVNIYVTSSNVGALLHSWIMGLVRSFGSRHTF